MLRKIILDKNDKVIYEDSYDYKGSWSYLGIHYDYKSPRGMKAMEKQAKREKKLAERKAKRQAKEGSGIGSQLAFVRLDSVHPCSCCSCSPRSPCPASPPS